MAKTQRAEQVRSEKELEMLREELEKKRTELADFYEHDLRVGKESGDESSDDIADRANNSYNRELMFSLGAGERKRLLEIEEAFQRLDTGTYGDCTHCGTTIGLPRLEAVPWAQLCIRCQELEEEGLLE